MGVRLDGGPRRAFLRHDRSDSIASVDLIPKALVVGLFAPTLNVSDQTRVTTDKINRIWTEVTATYRYGQLVLAADGSGCQFVGTEGSSVTIQPPLLQVQDVIELGPRQSHDKAQSILKMIARHLGASDFFNLGIKHVYHAPAPHGDGRAAVLHRILSKSEDELGELQQGGQIWGGVKYVVTLKGAVYTLQVEPLQADIRSVFIDLDVQFPGPAQLDDITIKASEAETYITQSVNLYLDKVLKS